MVRGDGEVRASPAFLGLVLVGFALGLGGYVFGLIDLVDIRHLQTQVHHLQLLLATKTVSK